MTTISEILSFKDITKHLECVLKNGDHDFETLDSIPTQISRNILSYSVVCIECGYVSEVFRYIEDSELL